MVPWVLVALGVIAFSVLVYWVLVIAEGVYLGQGMVTWLYDLTAHRYDRIKQFDPEIEAHFLARPILQALRHKPAPFVLDIATGTGRLPRALFDQPGFQGRIVGLDASRRMLEVAALHLRSFGSRMALIWRDGSSLPFSDGCFDTVTCLEMLEFTTDPPALLVEAARVLGAGGLLITSRRRGIDAHFLPGKTHTRQEFRAMLNRTGLTQVRIEAWQVDYDLVWATKPGSAPRSSRMLEEVIRCAQCNEIALVESADYFECGHCGAQFQIADGIVDLRLKRQQ